MGRKRSEEETVPEVPAKAPEDKGDGGEISWERPTGTKIKTNAAPATVKRCEELGWRKK